MQNIMKNAKETMLDNGVDNSVNNNGVNKKEVSEAISNLLNPSEIIETHISRVYLTDKFAYKQKKIVNFGFVDYTSLEKRIYFAKKELSLNRRACSGIYLDLLELRKKKDRYFIGFKGGKLIDVLVRMKRVDTAFFLSSILSEHVGLSYTDINIDDILEDILKKTAKKIYLFHKNARKSKRISKFGGYDVYKANWEDNFQTVKEYIVSADKKNLRDSHSFFKKITINKSDIFSYFSEEFFKDFFAFIESLLSSRSFAEFIRLRAVSGFVRDVHGDLRMEHIAILDHSRVNGICLMDCVEFDERYRCQDIYLDIAFLLMDFEFNGYFYESVKFLGYYKNFFNYLKYIAPFEQYEHLVIPLFKAYRAIVRCKISLLSKDSGEDMRLKAMEYFKLAAFYLATAQKPVVILNCGLSGSGKSSLSRLLSAWFYARVFSTDEIRHALYGSAEKSVKYSAEANFEVYRIMLKEGLKEFEKCRSAADKALKDDTHNTAVNDIGAVNTQNTYNNSARSDEIEGVSIGDGLRGISGGVDSNGSIGGGSGGGVIFDATFLKRSYREKIINAFNKKDCIFILLYSKIYDEKEEIILKRLENRAGTAGKSGLNLNYYSEADVSVYFNQKTYLEEPSESELKPLSEHLAEADGVNSFYSYATAHCYIKVDAADELKDRFNALMNRLQI